MTYERATYTLRRFEVVAPAVRNDGAPSGYAAALRAGLTAADFTGWTELETVGYWHGASEAGTTFVIYADDVRADPARGHRAFDTADILARLARAAMPDQVAIQVVSGETVTLREA